MDKKVFLDTTILTDALLKPGTETCQQPVQAIGGAVQVGLCQYAIKEFRAGPFSHFVWVYNKVRVPNAGEAL